MCGVFGIVAPGRDVARLTYFGLYALQHRGQESAGIAVSDGRRVLAQKDIGLVAQVFDESALQALQGFAAIGHARYSTTGSSRWPNAQPIVRDREGRTVALGHNGNLTNTTELRAELLERGVRLETTSDTEVIAALICEHRGAIEDAVRSAIERIEGAFSAIVLDDDGTMIGFRDPDGIRPLILGDLDGHPVLASESCALDIVGAVPVRELEPGEMAICTADGARVIQAVPKRQPGSALCIFEFIYFARPDTRMDGRGLHAARVRMGERLAVESPAEADVVISVPDSGTPAAQGFARASGIPFADGLVKNRYVGRTFIQPDQALREHGIKLKFNPVPDVIAGKRVVVVDDSIVRGTTSAQIIELAREAGAKKVYFASAAPPVRFPNVYGIDMPAASELVAAGRTEDEVRQLIGADWLIYQDLEDLVQACQHDNAKIRDFDTSCFSGQYVSGDVTPEYLERLRLERSDAAKATRRETSRGPLRVVRGS